jgi:hypothetical protein
MRRCERSREHRETFVRRERKGLRETFISYPAGASETDCALRPSERPARRATTESRAAARRAARPRHPHADGTGVRRGVVCSSARTCFKFTSRRAHSPSERCWRVRREPPQLPSRASWAGTPQDCVAVSAAKREHDAKRDHVGVGPVASSVERPAARATLTGVARVVSLPPAVLEGVRALALHGPVGEVTRDELDAWAETGELPACLAESSAPVPTSVRASHAKPSGRVRRRSAR